MEQFQVVLVCTIVVFINLVSCGTTPNIKEIIIGRCYDFQETQSNGKNPLLSVDVDCEELWEVFNNTIAYQDPCNITVETYEELFDIMNNGVHIRDKLMFWSGTYDFTKKLTYVNSDYIAVADTFPGYIFDNLDWCTNETSPTGFSEGDCSKCSPSTPFWAKASENFANIANGTVYLMLNSKYEQPYRNGSFFKEIELPRLISNSDVTKLTIYMLHDFKDVAIALCDSDNIGTLMKDAAPIGEVECYNNPPVFLYLLCAVDPDQKECVEFLRRAATITSPKPGNGDDKECRKKGNGGRRNRRRRRRRHRWGGGNRKPFEWRGRNEENTARGEFERRRPSLSLW